MFCQLFSNNDNEMLLAVHDGVEVLLEKKIFTPKVKKFSSCAPNIVMFHFSFAASSCTEIQ